MVNFKRIQMHVESQSYFGTLATKLNILKHEKRPPTDELIEELEFLQEYHKIT